MVKEVKKNFDEKKLRRKITERSGKSNKVLKELLKSGETLGYIGAAYGLISSYIDLKKDPSLGIWGEEIGGHLGGMLGSTLGTLAAVTLTVALGVTAGILGSWLIIAIAGPIAGSYLGTTYFEKFARFIGEKF